MKLNRITEQMWKSSWFGRKAQGEMPNREVLFGTRGIYLVQPEKRGLWAIAGDGADFDKTMFEQYGFMPFKVALVKARLL